METLKLSTLSLNDLKKYVLIQEKPDGQQAWISPNAEISVNEQRQLDDLQNRLRNSKLHLFNEATIWSRAIYPLLLLSEQDHIEVWAEIAVQAEYLQFRLEGIADGVIGPSIAGRIQVPYFVMVETKRGIEGSNPVYQLYGQLLAAAWMNAQNDQQDEQEIFGCYTIADAWTFVRAEVSAISSERPSLTVEFSPEYAEKHDALTILKILKGIVQKRLATAH